VLVPCTLKSTDDNFVGEVFFRQSTGQTITTELSASRSIQPNSDGAQVTQDAARIHVAKSFSPRWNGSIGATYIAQEAVGKDVAGTLADRFDRDYVRVEASISFLLSRTWSIAGRYAYSSDDQTSGQSITTKNSTVGLHLRYSGLGTH
jgi:hypothetical protein